MPMFHLHLRNKYTEVDDLEGHDLPDLGAAKAASVAAIRELLGHEAIDKGVIDFRGRVDIKDEWGEVLATVHFADAVEIKLM